MVAPHLVVWNFCSVEHHSSNVTGSWSAGGVLGHGVCLCQGPGRTYPGRGWLGWVALLTRVAEG